MAQAKFRYRLEKVLEFKIQKEDEEKEKLGKLMELKAYEESVLAQLHVKRQATEAELREKQSLGMLNVDELRFYPQFIKQLETQIEQQILRLEEVERQIVIQRGALLKAAQERKVYEKHREKSQEEWQKEQDMIEAQLIDELATIKFAREQAMREDD